VRAPTPLFVRRAWRSNGTLYSWIQHGAPTTTSARTITSLAVETAQETNSITGGLLRASWHSWKRGTGSAPRLNSAVTSRRQAAPPDADRHHALTTEHRASGPGWAKHPVLASVCAFGFYHKHRTAEPDTRNVGLAPRPQALHVPATALVLYNPGVPGRHRRKSRSPQLLFWLRI
jgi:hypothetical protein